MFHSNYKGGAISSPLYFMKFLFILSLLISIPVFSSVNVTVFAAADNSMIDILNDNLISMRKGTEGNDIYVNVMADVPGGAYHILIAEGMADTLSYSNNINAGDPHAVSDFLINSYNSFPADRFIVVLWDHGSGWYENKSILYDNDPDDFISIVNGEFQSIFSRFNDYTDYMIDMLILDACDMHSIEVLYEISDYVHYSLGSSIRMPYGGCPYSELFSVLSSMDIEYAGRAGADLYFQLYADSLDSLQISLVNMEGVRTIAGEIIKTDINALKAINIIDAGIPDSLISDYVYNVTDKDYISGIKMFRPLQYNVFMLLYRDYLKLKLQNDYDIVSRIFDYYGIEDTIAPEHIEIPQIGILPYSNIHVSFDHAYDFSGIESYKINALLIEDSMMYSFDDTVPTQWGVLSDEYFISKPYALFTDTLFLNIESPYNHHVIELYTSSYDNDGLFIIRTDHSCDTFQFYDNGNWNSNVFAVQGNNASIAYSGNGDLIYIDNIRIFSGQTLISEQTQLNEHIMHKLPMGNYTLYIDAEDKAGNNASISPLSRFSIGDSLMPYVYPNPANDIMNIVSDIRGEYSVSLYSSAGNMILSSEGITDNGIVRMELGQYNLSSGVYFFTINGKRGKFAIIDD